MSLTVEPASATFPATGGTSTHFIVSTIDSRVAFKVKSSNNENYRVRPVYGFIETKGKTKFEIVRLEGPVKDDKLVIQYAEVPADETEAQAPFKAGAQQGDVTILMRAS
uniref:MSP domain-containing protein n=1 Tax=Caenorhabditis tropicalis TaxID=1561998 RepID=A0A1I7TWV2_9PELO